jgi:pSer/pThr/pTyr-binding forkhead associated (FHA) protein
MVIIEITGEGKTPRFERVADNMARIGRALDNDIIIDDPYIEPHHLNFDVGDSGVWHVEDLVTENGTQKGKQSIVTTTLQSGDELTIGKTQIRFFTQSHQVPSALSLRNLEHRLMSFDAISNLLLLSAAVIGVQCMVLYLNADGDALKADEIMRAVGVSIWAPLLTAAFWSLIARLLRGESRFRAIFNITLLAFLLPRLVMPLLDVLYYNLPGVAGRDIINVLISASVMGVYLYVTLLCCTRLSVRAIQLISIIAAIGAITIYLIGQSSSKGEYRLAPTYDGIVMPPAVLFRQGESSEDYIDRLPAVFDEADRKTDDDDEEIEHQD